MRRVGTYLWRIVYVVTILLLGSNRWGDRSLYPDRWNHPVEIHVVSHGYHSGLVIPREALIRLSERGNRGPKDEFLGKVAGRFAAYSWIEIGWGEARFYREVPTVDALTVRLALSALFRPGNESVLHVVGLTGTPREAFPNSDIVRLELSQDGFEKLVARLRESFARTEDGLPDELGPGLYGPSLFYRANGSFHILNVCNHWTARLLSTAGVPTSPLLATHPAGLMLDLRYRPTILAREFREWPR